MNVMPKYVVYNMYIYIYVYIHIIIWFSLDQVVGVITFARNLLNSTVFCNLGVPMQSSQGVHHNTWSEQKYER